MCNATLTSACKHCGEPIKNDGEYGWVHVANAKAGSWYAYCEMNRNHKDHTGRGMTAAEPHTDVLGVRIERGADFYWVVVDGKPSYSCDTYEEARGLANVLIGGL